MFKFFKNRLVIAIFVIALIIFIYAVIKPGIEKKKVQMSTIIRVVSVVPENTKIEESMLREVQVGSYNLSPDTIKGKKEIIGKVSTVTLFPEDNLIPDKFKETQEVEDQFLYDIKPGQGVVSVTVKSLASGLSGKLRKGDIVGVVSNFNEQSADGQQVNKTVEYEELKYIVVASITNSKAQETSEVDTSKEYSDSGTILPATVSLITDTPNQYVKLIDIEKKGDIHLVFKGRGEKAKELLKLNGKGSDSNFKTATTTVVPAEKKEKKNSKSTSNTSNTKAKTDNEDPFNID